MPNVEYRGMQLIVPENDGEFLGYYAAARQHKLVLKHCTACGLLRFPPGAGCPWCMSIDWTWQEVSGKGTIYSFGVYYQQWHPGFKDDMPYNVALIELTEGPQIISQVVGCANEALACGLAVEVTFEDVTPEVTLPKFRLVNDKAT